MDLLGLLALVDAHAAVTAALAVGATAQGVLHYRLRKRVGVLPKAFPPPAPPPVEIRHAPEIAWGPHNRCVCGQPGMRCRLH